MRILANMRYDEPMALEAKSLHCLDNKALNRSREIFVADQSSDGRASHYIRLHFHNFNTFDTLG